MKLTGHEMGLLAPPRQMRSALHSRHGLVPGAVPLLTYPGTQRQSFWLALNGGEAVWSGHVLRTPALHQLPAGQGAHVLVSER